MRSNILLAGLLTLATAVSGLPFGLFPAELDVDARQLQTHRRDTTAGSGIAETGDEKRSISPITPPGPVRSTVFAREELRPVFLKAVLKRSSVPTTGPSLSGKRDGHDRLAIFQRRQYRHNRTPQTVRRYIPQADRDKFKGNVNKLTNPDAPPCGESCVKSMYSYWSKVSKDVHGRPPRQLKRRRTEDNKGPVSAKKRMVDDGGSNSMEKRATLPTYPPKPYVMEPPTSDKKGPIEGRGILQHGDSHSMEKRATLPTYPPKPSIMQAPTSDQKPPIQGRGILERRRYFYNNEWHDTQPTITPEDQQKYKDNLARL